MAGESQTLPTRISPVEVTKLAIDMGEKIKQGGIPIPQPMPSKTPEFKIDPEFRDLIPPLTPIEIEALRESLQKDGCKDKLVVSKLDGDYILLDGHNRKKLCDELGKPYETREISVANRNDAKIWITKNQIGRRNLNESQRAMLAVALKNLYAEDAKQRQGSRTDMGQNFDQTKAGRSAVKAAKDMAVSHQTVMYADKVVKKGIPELAGLVNAGKLKVSAAAQAAVLPPEFQKEVVERAVECIKDGKRANLSAIIRQLAPKTPECNAQEHIKKFNKNLDACLKLLEGIQTVPDDEDLAEMKTKVQEILAKLREIESLDTAKQNSSIGSEIPQTMDQNQSMEVLQAKGEFQELNSESSNSSDNNEEVEDEDEDEPDSDQDCQDGYGYPSDPVEDPMGDPYGYEESEEALGYDALMNDI
jgi:ParB-like chromosome segregation protein Spo0J